MWVFTIDGFYSAVQHRDNTDAVMVRARDREDLVRLLKRAGSDAPISHTPNGDYAYRITATKVAWAAYLTSATEAIDYSNFKSEVAARLGHDRADIYLSVWETMLDLQKP
jgi:hypothetical protein